MITQKTGELDVDTFVEQAKSRTGLADFGPDTWQEGLSVLISSLKWLFSCDTEPAYRYHDSWRERRVPQRRIGEDWRGENYGRTQ